MIRRLIHFSLDNQLVVLLALLLMIGVGIWCLLTLPIGTVPDITNVQVKVFTDAPGLGPVDVEKFITFPVEAAMSGLPRVQEIRSTTRFGLSSVTIVFEEGTDIYWARPLVMERIREAREQIPPGFGEPRMGPIATGLGEIYQFQVKARPGCDYDLMALRTILDWQIAFKLRSVSGVIEVNTFGGELKTYEVQADPHALVNYDISLKQLFDALKRNNAIAGGGFIVHAGEQRIIRGEGLIQSLEDVGDIVLAARADGTPIRVKHIGEVRYAPKIRQGAATRDGEGEVVVGIAIMLIGENSLEVASRVKARIAEIQADLPEGVYIEPYYDRTNLIYRTIALVEENISTGAILVVVMLFLLVGNLRAGLIVASAIPFSALFMFIAMRGIGVEANLMSLGALDFGIIVDGSVVMVENAIRQASIYRREHPDADRTPKEVFRQSALEVGRPILSAGVIIIIVFLPIFTLQGIEGKMFRPMAFTFMSALIGALILTLTVMPVLAALFLARTHSEKDTLIIRGVKAVYSPFLPWVMRHPFITLLSAVLPFALSVYLASGLGAIFIPQLDEGDIAITALRLPGVALQRSIKSSSQVEMVLRQFPEVVTVVSLTGRAEIPTEPSGPEESDIYVILRRQETLPPLEWPLAWLGLVSWPPDVMTTADSVDNLLAVLRPVHRLMTQQDKLSPDEEQRLRRRAGEIFQEMEEAQLEFEKERLILVMSRLLGAYVPATTTAFSQPIEQRFQEMLTGARADIGISLYGSDLKLLAEKGDEIMQVVRSIRGAADVRAKPVRGLPTIGIKIKRDAIARYGINAGDVLDAVRCLRGHKVGQVLEGEPRFDLQVRFAPHWRDDINELRQLRIADPLGRQIPLDQLAEVEVQEGAAVITRKAIQRRRIIACNVRGRDIASFVAEARRAVAERVALPHGYHVTWGGQFRNLQEATQRLLIAVPVALLLVFALLYLTFRSLKLTALIYLNVPIATTGGIFALWARDMPFSISAGVGFIALFGIAVMNGVVLIEHIRNLRLAGHERDRAVQEGALDRMRPVLMTACTEVLGFLPMAVSTGAGAEVQRPLATVVIAGVITSTLLTLVVLPSIYHWFEPNTERQAAEPNRQPDA